MSVFGNRLGERTVGLVWMCFSGVFFTDSTTVNKHQATIWEKCCCSYSFFQANLSKWIFSWLCLTIRFTGGNTSCIIRGGALLLLFQQAML